MKALKILLGLFFSLFMTFLGFADDAATTTETTTSFDLTSLMAKLPSLKNDIQYSIPDKSVAYALSFQCFGVIKTETFEDGFIKINGGWRPTDDLLFASGSFTLFEAGKFITAPILEYIVVEPYAYYGRCLPNFEEEDYGAGVRFIDIKF